MDSMIKFSSISTISVFIMLTGCVIDGQNRTETPTIWTEVIYPNISAREKGSQTRFERIKAYVIKGSESGEFRYLLISDGEINFTSKNENNANCKNSGPENYVIPKEEIRSSADLHKSIPDSANIGIEIVFSGTLVKKEIGFAPNAHMPFLFDGYFRDVKVIEVGSTYCSLKY